MKKGMCVGFVLFVISFVPKPGRAQAGIAEIIKQGVIKVIKAVDLKIQRLQNETIWLQNAQKTLENTMSKLKLDEISDWVEKQRKLYDDYFQELWQVKSAISTSHKVSEIMRMQIAIVNEYKSAYFLFQGDKNFTPEEINYIYQVYMGILGESLEDLDQIFLFVNSFATQMSDAMRIFFINKVYDRTQENLNDLRQFNSQNEMLSIHRAASQAEIDRLKRYYGIK
jgi:hypothetical protein